MKTEAFTGISGQYMWIECPHESLLNLLEAVPHLVVSNYLVNTSLDSDCILLSSENIGKGWHQHIQPERAEENLRAFPSRLTFTSPITHIEEIPYDEYDEWYVFGFSVLPEVFNRCEVFVNWCGFSLQDEGYEEFRERFWSQLEELAPETYLSENERLICVTKNSSLFEEVLRWAQSTQD